MKRRTRKYLLGGILGLFVLTAVAGLGLLRLLGFSLTDMGANLDLGASLTAKLTCSGYHLSGMDQARAATEINSYAPISDVSYVVLTADQRHVSATLIKTTTKTATFRPGLGCTINNGDTSGLDNLRPPRRPRVDAALPWPAGTLASHDPRLQERLKDMLAADNRDGLDTRALLVAHRGRLVAEAYASGFDRNSQLLGWSVGKSLTSIMLGHLVYRGDLTLDQQNLFAAWRNDKRRNITLRHMLQMTSGLDFNEAYAAGSDATRMLFTAPSAAAVALASPPEHPPGTHFAYSSGTTNLLMQLLSDRLGGPQAALDFLGEHIYQPMGLAHTTFEVDPSGLMVGSSYLYASARDFARMGQLMLNGGALNGTRLLSEAWVNDAQTPNPSNNFPKYGYQFWLNAGGEDLRWPELPADAYAMSGNRQQTVMIIPSKDVVLVRLGWTFGRYPLAWNFSTLLAALPAAEEAATAAQ